MRAKVALLVAGAVVAVAVGVWAIFFRASDEQRIRDAIARAAAVVEVTADDTNPVFRKARINGVFKEVVDKLAHMSAEDLRVSASGRDDLSTAATMLSSAFRTCTIEPSDLPGGASARVKGKATLSGTDLSGNRRRETRAVTFQMSKNDGQWQIAAITVWPPDDRP